MSGEPKKMIVPVPIPIYVPVPMGMYNHPMPYPVPMPIPIPVPCFIPTTKKNADKILKHVKVRNITYAYNLLGYA